MSKKPRAPKPRPAHGMECTGLQDCRFVRFTTHDGREMALAVNAPQARRMAAWLTRAAEWMEAEDD